MRLLTASGVPRLISCLVYSSSNLFVFVASCFEWFTASRSVAVESHLTRILKDASERAKIEREIKRESGRESIYLQEFGVITPTHVST